MSTPTEPRPGVSGIVCCHNSASLIEATLAALAAQRVPAGCGFEVVLVDNNCEDDTIARAHTAWGAAPFPLRVVPEPTPGLIHARRAGLEAARHEVALFVDDDNLIAPDWVEKLQSLFAAHPRVAAVGGRNEPLIAGETPAWFVHPFAGVYAALPQAEQTGVLTHRKTLYGAGLALRTTVAWRVFHEGPPFLLTGRRGSELSRGEDSELCLRIALLGWELWYEESLRLHHVIRPQRLTWDYAREARRNGGRADAVLLIYQELADGSEPLAFDLRCEQVGRLWQDFWARSRSIAALDAEGSRMSFRYSYLAGLTEGVMALGEASYMNLRSIISRHYGPHR